MTRDHHHWKNLAETQPKIFLEQAHFSLSAVDDPWVGETYKIAAAKDPVSAFRFANNFAIKPWAKDILLEAAATAPASAFEAASSFAERSWGKDVLVKAASVSPLAAKTYEYVWKGLSFKSDIEQVLADNPNRGGLVAALARRNGLADTPRLP